MRGNSPVNAFWKCVAALALLPTVWIWTASASALESAPEFAPVKYVFLFIGDGMGLPQRALAENFLRVTQGSGLAMNGMPHAAVTLTHSANRPVTDSAASATAIACGEKTNNDWLGLVPDGGGTRRLQSAAEAARDAGRRVGVVSSDNLNGATPAGFYAHNTSRNNFYEIGLDLVASGFDYLGGGGLAANNNQKSPNYRGDLLELARGAGYNVVQGQEKIRALDQAPGDGKVVALAIGRHMPSPIDAAPGGLYAGFRWRLADFTRQAIARLDNPKGFFLMVEESNSDGAGHWNDAAAVLQAVLSLDEAVAVALEFADRHPDDTLVIVTGDHETGGLSITGGHYELLARQKASRGAIADAVKRFGREPGKDATTMAFADLHPLLSQKSGLEFGVADKAGAKDPMRTTADEDEELARIFAKKTDDFAKMADELAIAVVKLVNRKAGIAFSTGGHSALPVVTTARGPGAQAFSGFMDNTGIGKLLKQVVR